MEKNTINVREQLDKYQANCDRIGEIADACEKEKRERNEKENAEYSSLLRENQILEMRMKSASPTIDKDAAKMDVDKVLRENIAAGRQTEIRLGRSMVTVADATAGGMIPLNIQDFLKPLEEALITSKVGLPLLTGLAGDYVWPVVDSVSAAIAGEGVALADTTIPLSKLTATPERIGIAIPVTRQTINQTNGLIDTVVRQLMPEAIAELINKIMFSTVAVTGATNLVGPFVAASASPVTLSSTPTFKELNSMKAAVLESGVSGEKLCWVMTKTMKAILEGEPVNSKGVYVPMIQNDMLCGIPVFTTNAIRKTVSGVTTEYIGIGDWTYQPLGLFGSLNFIVDPYSKARNDAVDFVLNANYGTKTLRTEAFKVGQVTAA